VLLRIVLVYLSENDLRIGDKELSADIWIGYTCFLLFLSQLSQAFRHSASFTARTGSRLQIFSNVC